MKFEKFLLKLCPVSAQIAHHQLRFTVENLQAAYTAGYDAGVTSGMLRAAEIAETHKDVELIVSSAGKVIAATIRKEAEDGST